MRAISRVFVANRGEIAVRIIKTCQKMNIETVLAVSDADRDTKAARMADRAVCIGPSSSGKSYLNIGALITAAKGTGTEAVHPGYGFLAEQPELGEACQQNGLIFIGPKPESIRKMGDKLDARKIARSLGIPTIPGSELISDLARAWQEVEKTGFPILLKAAAGGGGKGMKKVFHPSQMETAFREASAEAKAAFGDGRLYCEKLIPRARHIEIQILADRFGNRVHLFDRECTVQRRYQKMLEEAPSAAVPHKVRDSMCKAALSIAEFLGYENVGTVEFVLDLDEDLFYFLEMNTRIQVEHPVTELITGLDLIEEQIRAADGEKLRFRQDQIQTDGHAIECRINAECPESDFRPTPGRISQWKVPQGNGIRVDSHCFEGFFVSPYYDSLLAKVIVHGNSRQEALQLMKQSLEQFRVAGVSSNIEFLASILAHPHFRNNQITTRWVEELFCNKPEKDS